MFRPVYKTLPWSRVLLRRASTFTPSRVASKPAAASATSASTPQPVYKASTAGATPDPQEAEIWKSFDDTPSFVDGSQGENWSLSFAGLGVEAFPEKVAKILNAETKEDDIEITPDGLLYLPEIKYRRILNKAFGPGGWGLAPRSPTVIASKTVSREYGLVCSGRLVAVARGEQQYFNSDGIPTAIEGCKSNALMRCCKDLSIASELWDPRFIRAFKKKQCDQKWFEKKRRFVWKRKDAPWEYPYNS